MQEISFLKMHGAGNDFVIIDARTQPVTLTDSQICAMADRHKGVGFDQLVLLLPSQQAACFMRIYNPDASISATCGNATRCVASLLMAEQQADTVTIETLAGILRATKSAAMITVDMGKAQLGWQDIPLSEARDTLHLQIGEGAMQDPVAVSMGNPHAVFFVENSEAIELATLGPVLEHHPLFPARANISAAQIISRNEIKLRVWERGAGETLACGSGACATLVAACRRGLTDSKATLHLPGGSLIIEWLENGHVLMTGEAVHSFSGRLQIV
jgi:diaminopimelate epimerase